VDVVGVPNSPQPPFLALPRLRKSPLFDKSVEMMMWDTNSDEIAGILLKWIVRHIGSRSK
jgi:hypothetical protein